MGFVMKKTDGGRDTFEVLSCLHKSLRRGDEVMAMRMAADLLRSEEKVEKRYAAMLFNYLVTVAHEDIGVADMPAVTFVNTTVAQCREWHKAGKLGDCGNLVANCVVALCRAAKCRYGGNLDSYAKHLNATEGVPEIPDAYLDMHTRRGRALGRGQQHFMDEGERLSNAHPDFTGENDPYKAAMDPVWLKQYPTRSSSAQAESKVRTGAARMSGEEPSLFADEGENEDF